MTEQQPLYQPYPMRNRILVRALYWSLRDGLISRVEFAAMLRDLMGAHR